MPVLYIHTGPELGHHCARRHSADWKVRHVFFQISLAFLSTNWWRRPKWPSKFREISLYFDCVKEYAMKLFSFLPYIVYFSPWSLRNGSDDFSKVTSLVPGKSLSFWENHFQTKHYHHYNIIIICRFFRRQALRLVRKYLVDEGSRLILVMFGAVKQQHLREPIRSSDNDNTGFWPVGSLHTLGADGHI